MICTNPLIEELINSALAQRSSPAGMLELMIKFQDGRADELIVHSDVRGEWWIFGTSYLHGKIKWEVENNRHLRLVGSQTAATGRFEDLVKAQDFVIKLLENLNSKQWEHRLK